MPEDATGSSRLSTLDYALSPVKSDQTGSLARTRLSRAGEKTAKASTTVHFRPEVHRLMPYDLCFSAEFFLAPGEPEDAEPAVNSKGQPISLFSAISSMPADKLAELGVMIDVDPQASDFVWRLIDLAKKTDTATNVNSPIEVWIDKAGNYRVKVYSADRIIAHTTRALRED